MQFGRMAYRIMHELIRDMQSECRRWRSSSI